jgi:glutathione S-transferase
MVPKVREQLVLFDRTVAATGFIVGDRYSLADIYVMTILHYLKRLPESAPMLDPSTPLGRYHEAHAARPSFVQTIPPAGPPRRYAPVT